jgi:UDPglucose 6-dehydrogenase/GDP-mannose 6-dehydrogenase
MRVAVIGAGYVGLVTGACLADQGHDVTVVDLDAAKVDAVNAGRAPIHEQGLPGLLARVVGRTLRGTTDLQGAVAGSDVVLIAVGTPSKGGAIDLSAVESASRAVGASLRGAKGYTVVVVRSTVVPGTTEGLVRRALEEGSGRVAGRDFGLGMNPEFLTEGTALDDFQHQDRIVIGALDPRSLDVLERLYAGFPDVARVHVNPRTAEMIKYASNALLATSISYSNELANLASAVGGIDIVEVMRGVHLSRYLSAQDTVPAGWSAPISAFLEAGCGYGGSCLPKDVKALVAHGRSLGVDMPLLAAVEKTNAGRPAALIALLRRHFPSLDEVRVTVLGLAFKPDTDDVRETPAGPVVQGLLDEGARVTVHDPVAGGSATALFGPGRVRVATTLAEGIGEAQAIVLVTRWPEYGILPDLLAGMDPQPLVIDGRRMLDRSRLARYEGIGL